VIKEVVKEVPKEVIKYVDKPVEKEVIRYVDRPVEVIKYVDKPVEVIKEVVKQTPGPVQYVDREVVVEVPKEILVEKLVEVVKEIPVEVLKEVTKEVPVEVVKEVPVEVVHEVVTEVPAYVHAPPKKKPARIPKGSNRVRVAGGYKVFDPDTSRLKEDLHRGKGVSASGSTLMERVGGFNLSASGASFREGASPFYPADMISTF